MTHEPNSDHVLQPSWAVTLREFSGLLSPSPRVRGLTRGSIPANLRDYLTGGLSSAISLGLMMAAYFFAGPRRTTIEPAISLPPFSP